MDTFPLSIGQLAAATGTSVENIRYFERQKLLDLPARTAGGHRLYQPKQHQQLRFLLRARELGFSQAEIRTLMSLASTVAPCSEVAELATEHLGDVRRKIADLQKLEKVLSKLTRQCRANRHAGECPVLETLNFA